MVTEAHARTDDPITSQEAAQVVSETNLQTIVYVEVLNQFYVHGRLVSMQDVADITGIPLVTISPRFAPLRRAGLIEPSGEYQYVKSGRRTTRRILWRPVIKW